MAPYDCNASDADLILRTSDEKELRVHSAILGQASPVFKAMLNLPQTTESPSQLPSMKLPESSNDLVPFIQYLYPRSRPKIPDITAWGAVCAVAGKYQAEGVKDSLGEILLPRFLEASPLRVYALASRWGFEEEAKIASTRILTLGILKDLTSEDAELMGGVACRKLFLLHTNYREGVMSVLINSGGPLSPGHVMCNCSAKIRHIYLRSIAHVVGEKNPLNIEAIRQVAGNSMRWPDRCGAGADCDWAEGSKAGWLDTLEAGVSNLPTSI